MKETYSGKKCTRIFTKLTQAYFRLCIYWNCETVHNIETLHNTWGLLIEEPSWRSFLGLHFNTPPLKTLHTHIKDFYRIGRIKHTTSWHWRGRAARLLVSDEDPSGEMRKKTNHRLVLFARQFCAFYSHYCFWHCQFVGRVVITAVMNMILKL